MNLRASPRKGLNKNNEEFNVLRLKKSLFVMKPKSTTDPNAARSRDEATGGKLGDIFGENRCLVNPKGAQVDINVADSLACNPQVQLIRVKGISSPQMRPLYHHQALRLVLLFLLKNIVIMWGLVLLL